MGDYVFRLPDVGEGTTEAEVASWHVKVGDHVGEDQLLVDVMTDKAVVEMTSPVAGVVISTHCEVGDKAAVGAPLVVLKLDADVALQESSGPPSMTVEIPSIPEPVAATPKVSMMPAFAEWPVSATETHDKPLAAPAVRKRASERNIDLRSVPGTGPQGRITHQDLDAHLAPSGPRLTRSDPAPRNSIEEIKIVGLRRKIAERMQEAKQHIPHITYVEEIDLTDLEALRQHLNAGKRADRPKLTLLPFFMMALVRALPDFPQINARYEDEAGVLRRHKAIHLGIATQTASGLMVPVVRHAEARDLWDCAREAARLAQLARDGKAPREALSGSTITLSSLGALGGLMTTPIINRPEVAIVAPNKLIERPVVRSGQIVVRKMMNLSSSFDHRIVDGHDAASFVQRLKSLLEYPATLFLDAG